MQIEIDKYWAGTEQSLSQYVMNQMAKLKHGYQGGDEDEDEEEAPRLLNVQGSVGIISIRGSLTNQDRGYGTYSTTYPEIRKALIAAAVDPAVKAVLLDIGSGGGAVSGVSDTAKLIRQVDGMKPVYAHSDSMMCSAAYWLGSSARSVYTSEMAETGSVGVITTHMSYQRMYQEMGIDPTVIRSGEFKALGHPLESLSDKAKAVFQVQLDQMYEMFAGYVAERRGMNLDTFNKTAGEGRVFIGAKAVDAGLVDGITSFDKLMSRLEAEAQDAEPTPFGRTPGSTGLPRRADVGGGIAFSADSLQSGAIQIQGTPMKKALTEQQIAALAEGAALTVEGRVQPAQPAAEQTPASSEPAAAAPQAAQAPEPAAAAPHQMSALDVLQKMLEASQDKVASLTAQLHTLQAEHESAKTASAGLRAIAQTSVDRMKIALGVPSGVAAASDEALLAEHGSLRATFESKFKAGGVAAVAPTKAEETSPRESDPARQARIQATRLK